MVRAVAMVLIAILMTVTGCVGGGVVQRCGLVANVARTGVFVRG
jgi:hypothetical protein